MSTRSNIAVCNADGSVASIYCHWDGYPTNNGKILLRSYKTESKVRRLLSGGGISTLCDTIKGTTFYRKEDCMPTPYDSEEDWRTGDLEEWGYLFKEGSWFVVDCHCKTQDRKIVPLTKSYIEDYDKSEKTQYLRYIYKDAEKPFTDADLRDKFAIRKKMRDALISDGVLVRTKGGYSVH